MGWVSERLLGSDSNQLYKYKFLGLKGSSLHIFNAPPVRVNSSLITFWLLWKKCNIFVHILLKCFFKSNNAKLTYVFELTYAWCNHISHHHFIYLGLNFQTLESIESIMLYAINYWSIGWMEWQCFCKQQMCWMYFISLDASFNPCFWN